MNPSATTIARKDMMDTRATSHGLSIKEFISDVWQYTDTDAPFTEAEQDDIVELMNSGYTPSEAARSIDRQRATSEDV